MVLFRLRGWAVSFVARSLCIMLSQTMQRVQGGNQPETTEIEDKQPIRVLQTDNMTVIVIDFRCSYRTRFAGCPLFSP